MLFRSRFRESQEPVIVKLKVDLNQILTKIIEDLPGRRMRDIDKKIGFSEVPLIWGDPFYLHNAFRSIIENAIDAMPRGGTLAILTQVVMDRRKRKILVEISDTGEGMEETFIKDGLFSAFRTTKQSGLGLGLFTSKQIIAMHSGEIEVSSAPGAGTTFRIILPVENNGQDSHH